MKETKISMFGFVSAIVHSHIYWMYSIVYMVYLKITPTKQQTIEHNTKRNQTDKKFLTNVPEPVIIPKTQYTPSAIKQRKIKRRSSTGELFKKTLSTLIEVDNMSLLDTMSLTQVDSFSSQEDNLSSQEDTFSKKDSLSSQEDHVRKRDRAMGLLKSKFQKSYSTNDIHSLSQPVKRRKRDALLVIFSNRSNIKHDINKKRNKLFRSLPSWKKA